MKLALISYLHGTGGAERQIILLANEMAKRGNEVHLIVLCENNCCYEISRNVKVHDLSTKEKGRSFKIARRFIALKKCLDSIHPDVTVNYNIQGAYFSLAIGREICGKILYSERGDPYDKEYSGLLGKIRDITCKHIDAFVFQSEGAGAFFNLSPKQKSIVIHNSVNVPLDKYPMPTQRDNRIVSVGRLHPQKNPELLIDAFALIVDMYPEIELDLYGDGMLRGALLQKIDKLGLSDRIHLNKSRKDIFDCIQNARLFVLSSDYEGMPNALMEAMALGMPCISTDCRPGGARTLIDDGVNGYIVPTRDPLALANKMIFILDHPDEAERIAKEARHLRKTHTNEVTFNKWETFLESICLSGE